MTRRWVVGFMAVAGCNRCDSTHVSPDQPALEAATDGSIPSIEDASATDAVALEDVEGWGSRIDAAHATAQDVERCWNDPFCAPAVAVSMAYDALAASPTGVDCFAFYYGIGGPADRAAARRCFAAHESNAACTGSPSVERLALALMALEGQGGAQDIPLRAQLMNGCFADIAVQDMQQRSPQGTPSDPCKDITLTAAGDWECATVDQRRGVRALQIATKKAFPKLTPRARVAWNTANQAWDTFISQEAVALDMFRSGMSYIKYGVETRHIAKKTQQRASDLNALFTYVPSACGADGARDLAQSFTAWQSTFDPADKHLARETEKAWEAFRVAETALYVEVHGAAAECDVKARLAKSRTRELTDLVSDAASP